MAIGEMLLEDNTKGEGNVKFKSSAGKLMFAGGSSPIRAEKSAESRSL
jgi:hypothetical protein